jgi:hypothetical protein
MNDADRAVGFDKRFNFTAWRAHIRDTVAAKKVGETIVFSWDIGQCATDFLGRPKIEKRNVTYRKRDDGSWKVDSGDAAGTPDLNQIISPQVPDETLKSFIMADPCSA